METTRRLAARTARFALTYRAGSDTGLFAIFVVLAILGSFSPMVWLACLALGILLVARGFDSNRRQRLVEEARVRDYEARLRATYAPTYPH